MINQEALKITFATILFTDFIAGENLTRNNWNNFLTILQYIKCIYKYKLNHEGFLANNMKQNKMKCDALFPANTKHV